MTRNVLHFNTMLLIQNTEDEHKLLDNLEFFEIIEKLFEKTKKYIDNKRREE